MRPPMNPYNPYRNAMGPQYQNIGNFPPQQQPQQQQSMGGMSPMNALSIYQQIAGSGGSGGSAGGAGGGASSGLSGAGIAGLIAAAIAAQSVASNNIDRRVDGVKSGGIWDGHMTTEPWYALMHSKAGMDPTAGERFDAAAENGDSRQMMRRAPAMVDYWTDPARSWVNTLGTKALGSNVMQWLDPISYLLRKI